LPIAAEISHRPIFPRQPRLVHLLGIRGTAVTDQRYNHCSHKCRSTAAIASLVQR
jgi:hypothetical protein